MNPGTFPGIGLGGISGGAASATVLPTWASVINNSVNANVNVDPGSLTANTWKTVVSVTGKGVFCGAVVRNGDANARATSIRVTIDGVVVATGQQPSAAAAANSGAAVGLMVSNSGGGAGCFAPYNTSLQIEIRSSDTTTAVRYDAIYSVT